MESKGLFEVAARTKMRFPFKGMISAEDLWDLSVEDLDSIFKKLNSKVKLASEESLLGSKSAEDELLTTQIEIVKYIVGTKLVEADNKKQSAAKREQKQKIMAIIADKEDQSLQSKSVEELMAMLED